MLRIAAWASWRMLLFHQKILLLLVKFYSGHILSFTSIFSFGSITFVTSPQMLLHGLRGLRWLWITNTSRSHSSPYFWGSPKWYFFRRCTVGTKIYLSFAGMETSPQLVKTQWDALNLLKRMGFSVNDDNRKFDSFEDAQVYATRYLFVFYWLFFCKRALLEEVSRLGSNFLIFKQFKFVANPLACH